MELALKIMQIAPEEIFRNFKKSKIIFISTSAISEFKDFLYHRTQEMFGKGQEQNPNPYGIENFIPAFIDGKELPRDRYGRVMGFCRKTGLFPIRGVCDATTDTITQVLCGNFSICTACPNTIPTKRDNTHLLTAELRKIEGTEGRGIRYERLRAKILASDEEQTVQLLGFYQR